MRKLIGLLIFGLGFFHPPIIRANSLIFVDQFERANLSGWTEVQNLGSFGWNYCLDNTAPTHWRIKDGWANLVIDGVNCTLVIIPDHPTIIESQNWQIDFDWRLDESVDMDRNFVWWWQDQNNWYDVKLYGTGVDLQKVIAGTSQPLTNSHTTYPFIADRSYHFTIKYQNQTISLAIDNQILLTSFDKNATLTGPKTIALKTSSSSRRSVSSFDNLQIFNLSSESAPNLEVPFYKQTDLRWATHEYDTAHRWSENPTINRWGCALTSATMILNYYHLKQLPDGQPINPDSLNQWLLQQPDGYLGDGLLNWQAISRLSKEISQLRGTSKLEYQRLEGSDLNPIIQTINQQQPVILNIPGHFFVANGYLNSPFDLLILDPFYIYRQFSQHQQSLISARLFTPSFTDLSYLMIISEPDQEIKLTNSAGQIIEAEQFIEAITDQISLKTTQKKITQIAKPLTTDFQLQITNPDPQPSITKIFTYNQGGDVTVHQPETAPQTTSNWELQLSATEDQPTQLHPLENNWSNLIDTLTAIQQQTPNPHWYLINYLQQLAMTATKATPSDQKRYQNLIKESIGQFNLPPSLKDQLSQILNSLNLVI